MSFLSTLGGIGRVLLGSPLTPAIAGVFNPAAGMLLSRIQAVVVHAEQAVPGDGNGAQRSIAAKAAFAESLGMEVSAAILEARGEKLIYDEAKLQAFLDAQVALYNAAAAFKATIGTEKRVS